MTIVYRDDCGAVAEELHGENVYENSIDFCDGYVYFKSAELDRDGNFIERKIPVSALVRILY